MHEQVLAMHEQILELAVGDMLHIGDRTLTVIDIDGPEVSFRLDEPADEACLAADSAAPPRK